MFERFDFVLEGEDGALLGFVLEGEIIEGVDEMVIGVDVMVDGAVDVEDDEVMGATANQFPEGAEDRDLGSGGVGEERLGFDLGVYFIGEVEVMVEVGVVIDVERFFGDGGIEGGEFAMLVAEFLLAGVHTLADLVEDGLGVDIGVFDFD